MRLAPQHVCQFICHLCVFWMVLEKLLPVCCELQPPQTYKHNLSQLLAPALWERRFIFMKRIPLRILISLGTILKTVSLLLVLKGQL